MNRMAFHEGNIAGVENSGEDSSKDDEFPLALGEALCNNDTHNKDIQASTSSFFQDKGLLGYALSQINEFNDRPLMI